MIDMERPPSGGTLNSRADAIALANVSDQQHLRFGFLTY
jgi:hypothetical protein